jgi:hypothetical protein
MPSPPTYADIDPELIDILIKKEREERKERKEREEAQKQPFLQLPMPEPPPNYEKEPKKENNDEIIIIDL